MTVTDSGNLYSKNDTWVTPKEKAQELYDKFALGGWGKEHAKTCVDEIIEELKQWGAPMIFEESSENYWAEKRMNRYWQEVKKELEFL